MIHILTVHWRDDRWIDPQISYFTRNLHRPFRIYAFLNDLQKDHTSKFYYSSDEPIEAHSIKLNLLADIAMEGAESEDDLLIFVDGDAFPIRPLFPALDDMLAANSLVAVQRFENVGDLQPHPCFCAIRVTEWKRLRGSWHEGFQWKNSNGELVSDVGGNLLGILEEKGASWKPLRRSNRNNLHPLWFAAYGDLIYHHGAGFRTPISRLDTHGFKRVIKAILPNFLFQKFRRLPQVKRMRESIPAVAEARALSEQVFQSITNDPEFFRQFTE